MTATPRQHRWQVPLPTRSTDVARLRECPGSWLLQLTRPDSIQDASYFALGGILHSVVEQTILQDLDLGQALALASSKVDGWVTGLTTKPIETKTRTVASMQQDAERMVRSWFKWVHPDSADRLSLLDSYEFPPKVEVPFHYTDPDLSYPVWGRVDAIFTPKPGTGLPPLVIDWKSSVRRQRDDGRQLDFYRFGLRLPEADAAYLYLDRSRRSDVLQQLDAYPGDRVVRRRIRQAEREKQGLLDTRRSRFTPGPHCGSCVAKALCPVRGPKDARGEAMKALRADLQRLRPLEHIEQQEVAAV